MDIATVIGLLAAFGVILGAIIIGGSALAFIDIPSILIVIGGTFGVTLSMVSLKQFLGSFKVLMKAVFNKIEDPNNLIEEAVRLANVARKEGILALEGQEIQNDFLKKGIQLCVDGHPAHLVQAMLGKEIDLSIQRHESGAKAWKSIGDMAPAMGMIGTLIGLVQMLGNMDDPKSIGPAMAVALLTTLYGAIIANVFALPIVEKLNVVSEAEKLSRSLIIETITGIQEGMNPKVLEQLLKTFLPESARGSEQE